MQRRRGKLIHKECLPTKILSWSILPALFSFKYIVPGVFEKVGKEEFGLVLCFRTFTPPTILTHSQLYTGGFPPIPLCHPLLLPIILKDFKVHRESSLLDVIHNTRELGIIFPMWYQFSTGLNFKFRFEYFIKIETCFLLP